MLVEWCRSNHRRESTSARVLPRHTVRHLNTWTPGHLDTRLDRDVGHGFTWKTQQNRTGWNTMIQNRMKRNTRNWKSREGKESEWKRKESRVTTLQREKNPDFSLTFPDKIADNISNKCTFINTKSACYELCGAFQQLTKVNSKRWTSDMQNALKYEWSTAKLYDVLSTCLWTSQFC